MNNETEDRYSLGPRPLIIPAGKRNIYINLMDMGVLIFVALLSGIAGAMVMMIAMGIAGK